MFPFNLRSQKNKEPIFILDSTGVQNQESETNQRIRGGLLPVSEEIPLLKVKRLVVLVPDRDLDDVTLSREVWALASQGSHHVLFMTVIQDAERESRARRRLITLAAITRDDQTRVETQVCIEPTTIHAAKAACRAGDMLVCLAGHTVPRRLRKHLPLEIALVDSLHMPVILLTGIYQELEEKSNRGPLQAVLFWGVTLAILALFTWFEMAITNADGNWTGQLLLIFTFLVETGVTLLWMANAG
jgi:hypothetical protein